MKKVWMIMLALLMLTGCGARQTMETVDDVYASQPMEVPKEVSLMLPEDAQLAMVNGESRLYFCNGYEIMVETVASGDLNRTLADMTGYDRTKLTVMETELDGAVRYECVWTSAGESGDMVGRAVILDDGNYHYCLSVISAADEAGALQQTWNDLTTSFCI